MGRGDRARASGEGIEYNIAWIGERLDEELDQRSRERCRVRALAALGLHFDHIARPRDAGEAPIVIRGAWIFPAAEPRAPVPSRPLPEVDFGLFGRIVEAVFGDVADGRRDET